MFLFCLAATRGSWKSRGVGCTHSHLFMPRCLNHDRNPDYRTATKSCLTAPWWSAGDIGFQNKNRSKTCSSIESLHFAKLRFEDNFCSDCHQECTYVAIWAHGWPSALTAAVSNSPSSVSDGGGSVATTSLSTLLSPHDSNKPFCEDFSI